jgi:excinuclease ABC subunit C
VYRYLDAEGHVLYVGKAKNLRRRLQSYRNATRKKVHRKMSALVRVASRLEYEALATEQDALLREGELIRELKPPHNVDGAYTFLYPCIGVGESSKRLLLCFTTYPERFAHLQLKWYGCFRSRPRVKEAFDGLATLLSLVGHREPVHRLPEFPRLKGSRMLGLRQVPDTIVRALPSFFGGEQPTMPSTLAQTLLAKPRARREACQVEEHLQKLMLFYKADAVKLRVALRAVARSGSYVAQEERDALFIRAAFALEGAPQD